MPEYQAIKNHNEEHQEKDTKKKWYQQDCSRGNILTSASSRHRYQLFLHPLPLALAVALLAELLPTWPWEWKAHSCSHPRHDNDFYVLLAFPWPVSSLKLYAWILILQPRLILCTLAGKGNSYSFLGENSQIYMTCDKK